MTPNDKKQLHKMCEENDLADVLDSIANYCTKHAKEVRDETGEDDEDEAVSYDNMAIHLGDLAKKARKQKL